MAPTDVEITIAGARDLKNVNWKHGDLCAYAVAWVDYQAKVTSRVDSGGDTNPSWGQKFTLCVNQDIEEARLTIEIYHDKPSHPEKAIVGRATLPLMEVVDAGGFDETVDYSLKLKRPSGRPHGKADISLRLRERRGAYNYYPGGQPRDWQPGYSSPYPAQRYDQGFPNQPYPSYPSYGAPPPQPPYGAPPAQPFYGTPPPQPYYRAPPLQPSYASYNEPPPSTNYSGFSGYQQPVEAPKTSRKFGGIGTGLAVGALAGAVGGLALGEFVQHEENEAAEEQAQFDAEQFDVVPDDFGGGGRGFGGGDGYGFGGGGGGFDAVPDDFGGGEGYGYGDDF